MNFEYHDMLGVIGSFLDPLHIPAYRQAATATRDAAPSALLDQLSSRKTLKLRELATYARFFTAYQITPDQISSLLLHTITLLNPPAAAEKLIDLLKFFAPNAPLLRQIDVSCSDTLSGETCSALPQICPQAVKYDFSRCFSLSGEEIVQFAAHCALLKEINLSTLHVGDEVLTALSHHCHELQMANFSQNYKMTDAGLIAFAHGCRKVEELFLDQMPQISNAGVAAIAQNLPSLRVLSVNRNPRLTEASLHALAIGCPELESLHLNNCPKLNYQGLKAVGQNCKNLTSLHISGSTLSSEELIDLARSFTDLESLDLSDNPNVDDEVLAAWILHNPRLGSIHANNCSLTNATLDLLAVRGGRVRELHISGSGITDTSLARFLLTTTQLVKLDVSFCPQISYKSLRVLAKRGFPYLQTLILNQLPHAPFPLDTGNLLAIAQRCPDLREVQVWGMQSLSEAQTAQIRTLCPGLGPGLQPIAYKPSFGDPRFNEMAYRDF